MKYNWDIIGNEKVLKQLEIDIESKKISNSYLFSGSSNIGKLTTAKAFAGVLQCVNNYCGKCSSCIQISANNHLDTHVLEDDGELISIANIKNLIETLNMTSQSNNNIFILQNIERMNKEAANSFLKILEEPPENVVIILTTSNIGDILPTIVSRVRVLNFYSTSQNILMDSLKNRFPQASSMQIEESIELSQGKTGLAIYFLENLEVFKEYQENFVEISNLIDSQSDADKFIFVEKILSDKDVSDENIHKFFYIFTMIVRKRMLNEKISENQNNYIKTLSKIADAGILLKRNVNARLLLENLLISI